MILVRSFVIQVSLDRAHAFLHTINFKFTLLIISQNYIGLLPTAVIADEDITTIPAITSDSAILSNNSEATSEKSQSPPPPLPPKP
jgi:hypothetical protein